jgi:hypothetical protein
MLVVFGYLSYVFGWLYTLLHITTVVFYENEQAWGSIPHIACLSGMATLWHSPVGTLAHWHIGPALKHYFVHGMERHGCCRLVAW